MILFYLILIPLLTYNIKKPSYIDAMLTTGGQLSRMIGLESSSTTQFSPLPTKALSQQNPNLLDGENTSPKRNFVDILKHSNNEF